MLKADQVPREAWRAAMAAYYKTLRKDPGMAWQAAVIAAVENWPGVEASEYCAAPRYIHLPVPKEACDDPR